MDSDNDKYRSIINLNASAYDRHCNGLYKDFVLRVNHL